MAVTVTWVTPQLAPYIYIRHVRKLLVTHFCQCIVCLAIFVVDLPSVMYKAYMGLNGGTAHSNLSPMLLCVLDN